MNTIVFLLKEIGDKILSRYNIYSKGRPRLKTHIYLITNSEYVLKEQWSLFFLFFFFLAQQQFNNVQINVQMTNTHSHAFQQICYNLRCMQVKILNRQQTAHKCIHLTTCVQLRGKKFAMLSIIRVYLSYVSIACPFIRTTVFCDII